jgi:hypothetical protein
MLDIGGETVTLNTLTFLHYPRIGHLAQDGRSGQSPAEAYCPPPHSLMCYDQGPKSSS